MQIRRSVQCPTCGTNYFEGEGAGCPRCSGQSSGVARPLAGPMQGTSQPSAKAVQEYDPVCGWLVCQTGADNGRYLRIYKGKNSIGGGRECMLPIDFVQGVGKGAAALLVYDDQTVRFWLMNASGRDLVRVNGELLLESRELTGGEILAIGGAAFCFVPLCGPRFRWG